MLTQLLTRLDELDRSLASIHQRLNTEMSQHSALIQRLSTVPGIDTVSAQAILAELGDDMTQFPSSKHLASWAGLCPGNAESAGKRFSGKTRKADLYLRRILVQCAWAASRKRD